MKSRFAIILFLIVSVTVVVGRKSQWQKAHILTWDKSGYYIYLPAIFIYHDLQGMSFSPAIADKYHPAGDTKWYYLYPYPGAKRLNKYSMGTSLFELPFFVCADLYARISGAPRDGYSPPYQLMVAISTIFWVVLGLFVLRRFLLFYFRDRTVLFTLLCIAFGTNLFYYSVFDQGMSHPYSFFLFSCILYLTHKIYNDYKAKYTVLLGLVLGLITIVRPVNICIVVVPLFWGIYNWDTFKKRMLFIWSHWAHLLIAIIVFSCILLIQMSYWQLITGHCIHFSYEGESFNFLRPRLWKGLFSYRKGWFIYTPMALISFAGFIALYRRYKPLIPALAFFWIVMIYAIFSWRMWYYGGSFGCRPLVEAMAVCAIPLAALIESILAWRSQKRKVSISALVGLVVSLNLFQSYQYSQSIIHWDRMDKTYYWRVFGKTHITDEDTKYLMPIEEYNKEDQDDQR